MYVTNGSPYCAARARRSRRSVDARAAISSRKCDSVLRPKPLSLCTRPARAARVSPSSDRTPRRFDSTLARRGPIPGTCMSATAPGGALCSSCLSSGSVPVCTISSILPARSSPIDGSSRIVFGELCAIAARDRGDSSTTRAAFLYARMRNGFAFDSSSSSAISRKMRAISALAGPACVATARDIRVPWGRSPAARRGPKVSCARAARPRASRRSGTPRRTAARVTR